MDNSIFNYVNSNAVFIFKASIFICSFLVIVIKFIAFFAKRKKQASKQKETEVQKKELTALDLAAVNFSVITILCLCVAVFFLVQTGYDSNNICQYNLTEYWNILFIYLLLIGFIAPDIDKLLNTNFTNSTIFTKWFKSFEIVMSTLYIPRAISF